MNDFNRQEEGKGSKSIAGWSEEIFDQFLISVLNKNLELIEYGETSFSNITSTVIGYSESFSG